MDRSNAGRLPAALAGPGWRPAPRTVAPQELEGSGTLSRVPPASESHFPMRNHSRARRRAPPLDPARGFPRSTAAKAFVGFARDPEGEGDRESDRLSPCNGQERCVPYSQLWSCSPCSSVRAKRPVLSSSNRSGMAVRTRPFRRQHRSRWCPVGVRGPIPLPGRTRPSAPRTLSRISARGALPDRARPGRRYG